MVGVDVRLEFRAQSNTVHLRHHHVADDQVGHVLEDFRERHLAVGIVADVVFIAQFGLEIAGDLVVVLHNGNRRLAVVVA